MSAADIGASSRGVKVALVTGASSGIGLAASLELQRSGFTVYGAARRVERMAALRERGVRTLAMDVTETTSMERAVARIQDEVGRLDVLVNNAGYGSYGALEEVLLDEGRRQFEVNVFGVMRLSQLVIPLMRQQGGGRILNVTSVGGKIASPLGAWYHGTKFAVEGMSDALRLELRPFGIEVVVIEPGAIKTEWGRIAAEHLLSTSGHGAYERLAHRVAESFTTGSSASHASDPAVIATLVRAAATARRPRTRYTAGFAARPVLLLRRLLPDRAFDSVVLRAAG